MKKKLILLKAFYKKILVPSIFLLIITLIAELLLVYLLGTYRYFTLADRSFKNIVQDKSTLYVMKFDSGDPEDAMLSDLQAMSAVKDLYIYKGIWGEYFYEETPVKIILTNTELFRNYMLLEAERYFSETGMEGGIPQGITVGDFARNNTDPQIIGLQYSGNTFKVNLLGGITAPYYIPTFLNGGTAITTYDIMAPDINIIFMKDTPEVRTFFEGKGMRKNYGNFFLTFEKSTEAERQAVLDFLDANDLFYSDADTILGNSKGITAEKLKTMLPLPMYLTILATILTWCFSVLFLHKKMDLILTFYLCGCSKNRAYGIMAVSLGMIGALATLINVVLLPLARKGIQSGRIAIDNFVLDGYVFLYLICYWLLLLLLSVLAAFLIYRKKSVLSIRKRVDL